MTKPKKTKIAKVQRMLLRPSGVTIEALCKVTGWQAHSVRAALTGLRKSGHVIERNGGDGKIEQIPLSHRRHVLRRHHDGHRD